MKAYDYIIIGTGCAGLSLLMRILDNDPAGTKKILLVDKADKTENDRTWCFWEENEDYFEQLVHHKWKNLRFKNEVFSKQLHIGGYEYKMIRGIDFYSYCFNRIKEFNNIEIYYADVVSARCDNNVCIIQTAYKTIEAQAAFVFNSIFNKKEIKAREHTLLQHFKGWIIELPDDGFDEEEALFMDFSVDQKHEAEFVYMLPLGKRRALIEYTVFSKQILPDQEYEAALTVYIKHALKIESYEIKETEFGVIPMTNHVFPFYKDGVYNIGTAGGATKASTGYTFRFIQKQSEAISKLLAAGETDLQQYHSTASRFHLYDSILLRVLCKHSMTGKEIFSRLFKKIPASQIFKFLDNETTFGEEVKILNAMPFRTFIPAAFRELIK